MFIGNRELLEIEENFVNNILHEFKKYSETARFDYRNQIIGIGEPNMPLYCYFRIINNELYIKFKEQKEYKFKEGLDLSNEVIITIELFKKTNYYLDKSRNIITNQQNKAQLERPKHMVDLTSKNGILYENIEVSKTNVIEEENINLKKNYKEIYNTINNMPYIDISPYAKGIDKEEREYLSYKKEESSYFNNQIEILKELYKKEQLYIGHISISGEDCYISDSGIRTQRLDDGTIIINADDKNYNEIIKKWKFPQKYKALDYSLDYSRNIDIEHKQVINVDIIYDSMNDIYSSIQDQYLLKTLVKNKSTPGIKSIIKTIQEKQDNIVTLSEKETFALQGCAGSGKTMVLLHRLRYLLYNNNINDNFLLLVPSIQFKEFIKEAAKDFRINNSNISTYKEYFVKQCGKTMDNKMIIEDEINFDNDYLIKIYDKNLIKKCLIRLVKQIYAIGNKLIEYCEGKINILLEKEKTKILNEKPLIQKKFIELVQQKVDLIKPLLVETTVTLQNVNDLILTIKNIRDIEKDKYDKTVLKIKNYKVSKEDLLKDNELFEINKLLLEESELAKKASIFTRESHKRKLQSLNNAYIEREIIVKEKLEKEAKKRELKLIETSCLAGNININQLDEITNYLLNIQERYIKKIKTLSTENIETYLIEKYQSIGNDLNKFIVLPEQMKEQIKISVNELTTIPNEIFDYIELGKKLLNELDNKSINEITGEYVLNSNISKLFNIKTRKLLEKILQQVLMNSAKNFIKEKFNIKISNVYKHYWYLNTYFDYLIKGPIKEPYNWIYIDEAQDLSNSELELIYKLNNKPIINLFGDVNQVIMPQGIKTWEDISYVTKIKNLNENFRNTNQIIDYCNKKLHYQMKKVGVDSNPVLEYETMEDWYKRELQPTETIFIVKDNTAKDDLSLLLQKINIKDAQIYTVKEAKGLEFFEVVVFERDMTDNEKYISYTRALDNLTIIKTLPKYQNPNIVRIIEVDEEL